jgi:transcriptional regulator with XRE-family HTH domain
MAKKASLAEIVRRERRAHGWSQEQLSRAAGLNLRTVQRVERGSACSGETLQALASALDLRVLQLTNAVPDSRRRQVFGLSGSSSKWAGAILCMPALIFVVFNISYFELNVAHLAPIMESAVWTAVINSPVAVPLLLGGPAIALALIVPNLITIRANSGQSVTTISGLVFRWSVGQWLIAGLAFLLLATLVAYGVIENGRI